MIDVTRFAESPGPWSRSAAATAVAAGPAGVRYLTTRTHPASLSDCRKRMDRCQRGRDPRRRAQRAFPARGLVTWPSDKGLKMRDP